MNYRLSKKLHQRIILLITLSFSLFVSACNGGDNKKPEAKAAVVRPVKTITVKPASNSIKKTYSAVVLATQQVDLSFRVSGKLQQLPIKNGMEVKKGDVIAQLDKRDFQSKITQLKSQINQANAQMKAMKAGARPEDVASLNSAVTAAQAELNQAQIQFNRTAELVKKQVIARNELDKDRSALTVAKANLNSKKQELRKGKAGGRKEDVSAQVAVIQGLQSQLKNLEDTLADATLRAPFDGRISSRQVENFANVQAKESIATIQKTSSEIDIVFNIPAPDIVVLVPIKDQLKSTVVLDSYPGKEFPAEQREFSSEADSATQTYQGRVAIKTSEGEPILPGMTGNLIVTGNSGKSDVYSLPVSAIASQPSGQPFIWVVDDANKVSKRDVTIGEASGANVAVSKGIQAGDVVVTAGISALQDSMTVKPITAVGE
ncbi:efflux RND transporter periplasmic adaptor subunit [Cocleimonas flava]|uniref:RND family efflux transporter MFP subunit n=1 Tax=Cocleimonas flava TaxID=634765 RepID=A0A4R1F340_9GAMM|nr:efflux RND transporter periplasmic adaptor subunit [Cocleimonas flava]TCJ86972.1 RND family efflux transporter MFP subunit [Cocleimonas flava]